MSELRNWPLLSLLQDVQLQRQHSDSGHTHVVVYPELQVVLFPLGLQQQQQSVLQQHILLFAGRMGDSFTLDRGRSGALNRLMCEQMKRALPPCVCRQSSSTVLSFWIINVQLSAAWFHTHPSVSAAAICSVHVQHLCFYIKDVESRKKLQLLVFIIGPLQSGWINECSFSIVQWFCLLK